MRRILVGAAVLAVVLAVMPLASAQDSGSQGTRYQIVNGEPAAQGAYPWMAAFLFDGEQGCGGSVIAPTWILTAAHCVADDRGQPSTAPGSASFVVDANNWRTEGVVLTAAEIVIHPAYDAVITNNDVALVRTNEATDVAPVRLAGPGDAALDAPPTQSRVIGYGTTSTGGPASDVLLQVDVDVVSDPDCRASGYDQLVDETMVCAGNPTQDPDAPGRDSCQGDSGGPLFATVDEEPVQHGVVSFGGICGVGGPGVYAQVTTYLEWIQGVVGGELDAGDPDPGPAGDQPTGAAAPPVRVQGPDGDDPVGNAIAMSQLVFQQDAAFGVLAASSNFPDALGGSALASYFGPLLYVDGSGRLGQATLAELQRTVPPGGVVYLLGGTAAIDEGVDQVLADAGFLPVRLAGSGRQETARLVAEEVDAVVNGGGPPPFDSVIVAFEGNWPDAVAVGQISAWFGIPVLLTPQGQLGGPAAQYLQANQPSEVFVLGGDAVIGQAVRDQIAAITGPDSLTELQGATRLETSAVMTLVNRFELFPANDELFEFEGDPMVAPELILAVNLRRPDAFAHVLAAAQVVGNFGGVFAPLEGDGTTVDQVVLDSVCGMDAELLLIGGPGLVGDQVVAPLQAASAGEGCAAG